MKKHTIVDTEMRVLHPAARVNNYLSGSSEVARKKIYEHPEFAVTTGKLSAEGQIRSMDENGIQYGIISGLGWQDKAARDANNQYVKMCVESYPDRFRANYIVNPLDPVEASREILSLDNSFVGVEIMNNYSGGRLDDFRLKPIIDAVIERNLLLKTYCAHSIQTLQGDTAYRLLGFLRNYPMLKVLAGHLGGLLCLYGLMPEIRKAIKNTYFITSVSSSMQMVKFAAEVNEDNLLFGTDTPFNHCHNQEVPLRELLALDLTDETQSKILGGTALRLLDLQPLDRTI